MVDMTFYMKGKHSFNSLTTNNLNFKQTHHASREYKQHAWFRKEIYFFYQNIRLVTTLG